MTPTGERPVVLVGAGNMGGAMLEGWLARGLAPDTLVVVDPAPREEAARRWREAGVRVVPVPPGGIAAAVLLLAVKPQAMAAVLPTVRSLRAADTLVLSVAAGITLATLADGLGQGPAIRSIPNTPAAVGKGVTVAVPNAASSAAHRHTAETLLSAIGTVHFIADEADMDAVTAVSGSGPAYVFHMVEALSAAGTAAGLDPLLAGAIARQTVVGAAALMDETGAPADELRRNVTSPGGTTAAALEVLMAEPGLTGLMTRAVDAAARRSRELGG